MTIEELKALEIARQLDTMPRGHCGQKWDCVVWKMPTGATFLVGVDSINVKTGPFYTLDDAVRFLADHRRLGLSAEQVRDVVSGHLAEKEFLKNRVRTKF